MDIILSKLFSIMYGLFRGENFQLSNPYVLKELVVSSHVVLSKHSTVESDQAQIAAAQ